MPLPLPGVTTIPCQSFLLFEYRSRPFALTWMTGHVCVANMLRCGIVVRSVLPPDPRLMNGLTITDMRDETVPLRFREQLGIITGRSDDGESQFDGEIEDREMAANVDRHSRLNGLG